MNKIACSDGKYNNFTGVIMWGYTEAVVKNATFYLSADIEKEGRNILWHNGIWQTGYLNYGIWYKGIWVNGTWNNGYWFQGIWKAGTWESGVWKSGTWENGIWKAGTWENGVWKAGAWDNGIWKDGTWVSGSFGVGNDSNRCLHTSSPNNWNKNNE